jgi:hypothetical protein
MHAAVRLLFEDGGRPLPLHRMAMAPKLHIGQFDFGEIHLRQFRRVSYCATLTMDGHAKLIFYDAVLRYAKDGELTISGLEFDEIATKFKAISTLAQPVYRFV